MRSGISSPNEEGHKLLDELVDVVAVFGVQKPFLLDGVKHSAFLLVLLSQLLLYQLASDDFEQVYPPIHVSILLEKACLQHLQTEKEVSN